jgi:serine/threonine protein kinase
LVEQPGQHQDQDPQDNAQALQRGDRLGPYCIQRFLAQGGMGRVYLAEDSQKQPVALKVLGSWRQPTPEMDARFQREGAVLEHLEHPNLVRLLGRGLDETTGLSYLALEYVPGRALSQLIDNCPGRRLSVSEAVFVLERVSRGLEVVHAVGILHRDVKAPNILVTTDGDVKLTDFGLALPEEVSQRLTAHDMLVGTPAYLAPEVLEHPDGYSPASDMYSVGCLMFRMLTGAPPLRCKTLVEYVRALRTGAPPLLSQAPEAPPALAELVDRLLARDAARRPTASELLYELKRLDLQEVTETISREWGSGRVGAQSYSAQERSAVEEDDEVSTTIEALPALEAAPTEVAGSLDELGPGARVGEYHILRPLGRGAMAAVYLAEHDDGRRHAIKVMAPQLARDQVLLRRFEREVRALARVEPHPGIVSLHGTGRSQGGLPFYAMDYVDGRPFSWRELNQERGLKLLEEVADALGFAHAHGLVHRDIKPENVLVEESGGRARLTDFGLSKVLAREEQTQQQLTMEGEVLGTPAYMAPEQANPDLAQMGPWTDVYALGVMLYEVLSGGRRPYEGRTSIEVVTRLFEGGSFPPPHAFQPGLHPVVEGVCLRALARYPAERYRHAGDLARDLRRARESMAIPWRPVRSDQMRARLRGANAQEVQEVLRVDLRGMSVRVAHPLSTGQRFFAQLLPPGWRVAPLIVHVQVGRWEGVADGFNTDLRYGARSKNEHLRNRQQLATILGSRAYIGRELVGYLLPDAERAGAWSCYDPGTVRIAQVVPCGDGRWEVTRLASGQEPVALGSVDTRGEALGIAFHQVREPSLEPPLDAEQPEPAGSPARLTGEQPAFHLTGERPIAAGLDFDDDGSDGDSEPAPAEGSHLDLQSDRVFHYVLEPEGDGVVAYLSPAVDGRGWSVFSRDQERLARVTQEGPMWRFSWVGDTAEQSGEFLEGVRLDDLLAAAFDIPQLPRVEPPLG